MKKFYTSVFILALAIHAISQTPQAFNYQAIARSNSGEPLTSQNIGVRIDILSGSITGISVYQEAHSVTTNDFGLFSLEIGSGTNISGSFISIDWAGESKYIEVAIDPGGGTSYQVIGTVQLLSVPYALYSESSGGDADADPNNEIQHLALSGTSLSISDGNSVNLSSINSDEQNLSLSGTKLTISNGNAVDLKSVNTDQQNLTLSGTTLSLTGDPTAVSLSPFVSPWTITSESDIYRTSGNIGIGVTSPVAALHLYANRDALFGSSMSGNGAKLIWDYSSRALRAGYAANSSWNEDSIGLYSAALGFGTVAEAYMSFAHGFLTHARTYGGFSIGRYNVGASGNATSWTSSDPLFEVGNGSSNTNRNNALTIRKDGLIGINDATPNYLLDIENPGLSNRSIYINHDVTSSPSTMYGIFVNADNTAANSGISYAGYFDMTNNNDDAYGIYSLAFCDATDGSPAYGLRSYVDNDNGSGAAFSIYGSVAGSTSGPKYAAYFNGDVYSSGSYLPSDKKLKTNIQLATENSTQKLMQLQVASFEYLKNAYVGMNLPQGMQTGLIAQDVEQLFPELVKETVQPGPTPEEIERGAPPAEDVTFKAVDYTRLIPHLLKALQEQQAEIETLKKRIDALEK